MGGSLKPAFKRPNRPKVDALSKHTHFKNLWGNWTQSRAFKQHFKTKSSWLFRKTRSEKFFAFVAKAVFFRFADDAGNSVMATSAWLTSSRTRKPVGGSDRRVFAPRWISRTADLTFRVFRYFNPIFQLHFLKSPALKRRLRKAGFILLVPASDFRVNSFHNGAPRTGLV